MQITYRHGILQGQGFPPRQRRRNPRRASRPLFLEIQGPCRSPRGSVHSDPE